MWRAGVIALALMAIGDAAQAQPWGPPYNRGYGGSYYYPRSGYYGWGWGDDDYRYRRGPAVQSGGERPAIERLQPKAIAFPSSYPVGSIVIDSRGRQLFLIQSPTEALHYPISVGREGFSWAGTETISRKAEWPDWYPPEEMRDRDPKLPVKMTGGVKNPLGAMALYLGTSLYRIHGTNDAKSIGRAASSGCFRMLNGHIVDLSARVEIGTPVTVVHSLAPELERMVVAQVAPQQTPAPAPPQAQTPPQAQAKPTQRVLVTPQYWSRGIPGR